ncbi:MAG TPA: alpha/beta-hydrolase N-terminal domain-containing protein, partial [Nordella sp.]|nr:alpha/beta-hydrolase N-terminal domain-containing protein [Nordella sp.]
MRRRWLDFWHSLSGIGLLLGTLFFAAALTPTLVPRTYLTQGVLAGASFALGYGIGVFWRWLWAYLELPEPRERLRSLVNSAIAVLCIAVALVFLWRTADWQNSIRLLMQMEPVTSAHPVKLSLIALVTFIALLVLARLFRLIARFLSTKIRRFVPKRVANVIGVGLAVLLFWLLANDMIFRLALQAADSSFREFDALIEPERPQPTLALKTGSSASLVRWNDLGRAGREFVTAGPSAEAIGALTGRTAKEPIRVYVGLNAAETAEERARLALEELKRVGGFERSLLIVITPTGTGWIDPSAIDGLEYLHDGDVASVAQQYSYLSSPLSLIVQPEYGEDAARALFR